MIGAGPVAQGSRGRGSLDLNFDGTVPFDPRISFTRSTTATRVNSAGLIELVPINVPRIDYNPATLAVKGLLIEEARTNLLTYSEDFNNAAWTKGASSVSANAATAPDGTFTADKFIEDSTYNNHQISCATSTTGTYTFSVYAKASTRSTFALSIWNGTASSGYNFNLATGALGSAITGNAVSDKAIVSVGNGWYRCSITCVISSGSTLPVIYLTQSDNVIGYTGDGVSGLYLWGAQLEAGAFPTSYVPSTETWTGRATSATYYNSAGQIATASSGVARYTYNPANLTVAPKLLLEEARTNLLTYSEAFDNAAWGKANVTVAADATTAPDGATTADSITKTAATSYINQAFSFVAATTYTFSIYAKAKATSGYFSMVVQPTYGNRAGITFNLNTGVVVGSAAPGGSTTTIGASSITSVGSGWYRCTFTVTNASTVAGYVYCGATEITGSYTDPFGGSVLADCYVFGAQLEAGAYPTSYIPTTSAQVTRNADTSTSAQTTRAADTALMTGTNFSEWYRQDEGTFVISGASIVPASASGQFNIAHIGTSNADGMGLFRESGTDNAWIHFRNGNSSTTNFNMLSDWTSEAQNQSLAFGYKAGDSAASFSGAAVVTSSVALPTAPIDSLQIGSSGGGVSAWCGHIKRLTFYPSRLPNATLQALTS